MNIEYTEGGVCAPQGYRASSAYGGFRRNPEKNDVSLIVSDAPAEAAAVYTKNKVKAAHIAVMKRHLQDGTARAVIVNSGNANTCCANGEDIAEEVCRLTASKLGLQPEDVLPASTGVIGVPMTMEPFEAAMPDLIGSLSEDGSAAAAAGIMTTDTVPKEYAVTFECGGKTCTIGGIAKGSGMIHINMGTMLCFMTTDAAVSADMLHQALLDVIPDSLNQVSVDGDTSTNDTFAILANGLAGNEKITAPGEDYERFREALLEISIVMAKKLASDGEGATKLIEAHVVNAPTKETARLISRSIIHSSLLKAAIYGQDANWGRILCAIGYTDADFSAENIDVTLASSAGSIDVCRASASVPFSEDDALRILEQDAVDIFVDMHDGSEDAYAWGCDLTHEYVTINGSYRS